ncbi:MAG: alcohol dehydrogenase catalytic domain-containing protein [Anaerolineae bacterium]|nr:alcohol dehydrogenase catalytic domain-containing protein [Anaerolineae bacterium]MCO5207515.1 alcohol dehydrogenase catalytic domain-containing protein [Anaerolineae bacterium]
MRTMYLDLDPARIVLTRVLGKVWRGAYFARTSPLHLVEMADPPLDSAEFVRVRNRLCGICGSDLHQLFVDAGLDVAPVALPSNERIYLGHEMVGEVVEVGANVINLQVGDRVVRWGRADDCLARGSAELCPACKRGHRVLCQRASEPRDFKPVGGGFGDSFITPASSLVKVLPELSDEQAIFTEPCAVAIHAAWRRIPNPGEKVLVIGMGTIGFLLVQAIRALQPDCLITAVAQFDWQAELARELGADDVFMAHEDGYAVVGSRTNAQVYTGRGNNRMLLGGYDVTFDVVGIEATLNNALRWTRAGGDVVIVGVNLHRMKLDVTPIWYQEVNLLGAIGHDVVEWAGEPVSTFDLAQRWMRDGLLRVEPLLTHTFALDDYREAFAVAIDKANSRSIKVAFTL